MLQAQQPLQAVVSKRSSAKKKIKIRRFLFNLAELQNVCSKLFKISPDETLRITQELYEKKLVTYPRTDAQSTYRPQWQKKFTRISHGLRRYPSRSVTAAEEILQMGFLQDNRKDQICQ